MFLEQSAPTWADYIHVRPERAWEGIQDTKE